MTQAIVTPRRSQTRERLIDAAVVLFAEKGVLGASVEEICERAQFTRGAFYSNFSDKDALCLAVLIRQAARELAATEEAVDALRPGVLGASSIEELVDAALSVFISAQPRSTEDMVAGLELRLYAIRNPALRPAFLALNAEMVAKVGGLLETAVDRVGARMLVPTEQAIDLLHAVYALSLIHICT